MQNRNFDYEECKRLIIQGILHSLEVRRKDIIAFPRYSNGTSKIRGMSMDIFPWHNLIQISFCDGDDEFAPCRVPDWTYFDFIDSNDQKYERLARASNYISEFWEGEFDDDGNELEEYFIERELKSEAIFWAGAATILDSEVTDFLKSLEIEVSSPNTFFIVSNDDAPNRNNNYCEKVLSFAKVTEFFNELAIAKSTE